jgi:RF-1 domain
MSDRHPACWSEEELLAHCKMTFSRVSGPGGQNRNKVETSVQIEFLPAKIAAHASERRTQNENRKVAVQRLRCKLAVDFQIDSHASSDSNANPSELWGQYCVDGRVNISESNIAWPTILAELINSLCRWDWDISQTAIALGTSTSQLVKLLKRFPPAFTRLNTERAQRG